VKPKNSALAFLLALLTALSVPAAFVTRAQSGQDDAATPAPAARKPYAPMPPEHGHAYVVNMVDGRVACRDATPAERLRILQRDPNVKTSPRRTALGAGIQTDSSNPGSTGVDAGTSNFIPGHLDIVLRPTDKLRLPENAHVLAAFERAAAVWENLITSEITVVVDVDYGTTRFGKAYEENVLGSTSGGVFYIPPYSDVRNRLVARATAGDESNIIAALPAGSAGVPTDSGTKTQMDVGSPLARALGAIAPHANPNDTTGNDRLGTAPSIGFNSTFNFDFDPSDGISAGKSDFDAVVVHEIGHVLGFDSEVGSLEVEPTWTLRPTIWDLFRFRPGTTLGTFATAQRVLTTGGEQRYFDGTLTLGLSTANPEGNGGDGEQASHWKDDRLNGGVYIGIMDPTLSPGTRRQLTANDRRALDFMGYNLGALPAGPDNDNFVNAVTLQGTSGTVTGTNINATKEIGEPPSVPQVTLGGRSVWYRWVSPVNGTVTFNTVGSNFDTTISAYTGAGVTALSFMAANDDINTEAGNVASSIQFNVSAGTVYRVMVDGYDGDSGSITLNWTATGTTPTPTPTPTPAPQFFNVSGRVTDAVGNGIAGVRVGLSSPVFATTAHPLFTTDSAGNYSMQGLAVGTLYTVSPIPDGQYRFSPGPVTFSGAGANMVFNFTASPGNPIDGSTMFVQQHYRDFLGREADSSGLGFWTGDIESCGGNFLCREAKRINVSAAFFLSIEFQQTGYLVERMHKAAFGDAVEASTGLIVPVLKRDRLLEDTPIISSNVIVGQGLWQQQLETNKTNYAQVFVQRAQFLAGYPATMTAEQFVDKLFQSARVTPTAAERAAAVAAFGSGNVAGRAAALRSVAESATLDAAEKNRAFVLMQYFGYLRRNPNDAPEAGLNYAGWNFWLGKLNEHNGNAVSAEMVKAFLDSSEYRGRFGTP
jgi:hypothetical protein